jgi:SAM-dependent methyltransferase
VLEVGGSFGFLLRLIKTELFCDVTNFELSENAANYSRTTNQIKTVSRFDESVIDGDYDAIICAHFIEHIAPSDMEGFIKNIFEKLKPGGQLILLTPNGMSDKINLLKKHYVWLAVPEHISFLSSDSAQQLLIKHGFGILESSTEIPCFEHYPTNSILQYFIARVLRKESAAAGIKNDFKSNRSRLFIFLKSILRSLYFIEKILVYPVYFIYDVFHTKRDELVIIAKK